VRKKGFGLWALGFGRAGIRSGFWPKPKAQGPRPKAFAFALVLVLAQTARADVTVALFAPSEPFPSTAARVELANNLGAQVGKALGGSGNGKVFARAGDFAAAVKKGDVTVALVDSAYLAAAGGNYTVIAAATRGGDASHAWQLVGKADKIGDLKGKHVLVPTLGGREADFVANVLLGGEVGRDFFGKIEAAPDSVSALAALGLGKADAAVVPADVAIPSGTRVILTLPQLPGPVLVAYGSVDKAALAAAAPGFSGDATIAGFRAVDAEVVRAIARRFAAPVKRGPLAVPAVRLLVGDLVEGRTFAIERTPATAFVKMR
jgi:hypothetical protein